MILKTARVENFKCIDDTTEFSVPRVTCLVGKNEAGKTAVLQALHRLNPDVEEKGSFEDLHYPRRRFSEYKERRDEHPDNVLTTCWMLEDKDKAAIAEKFGAEALKADTVTIKKGYDNQQYWEFGFDEKKVIQHYLATADLSETEQKRFSSVETVPDLFARLKKLESPSQRLATLLKRLQTDIPDEDTDAAAIQVLDPQLPKFLYFPHYDTLPGRVSINKLRENLTKGGPTTQDRMFLALLDLAGTTADEIDKTGKSERLFAELEAIQARLSAEIFEYWSQNKHLEVQFRFDQGRPEDGPPFDSGYVFHTRIRNNRHGVTVPFDERSAGFVWFFSFLVWFSQVKKIYGDNLLILLDDPALTLHGRAQYDLLRYIKEKLQPYHQVIYTTHSPWMIDPDHLPNVRTVEDVVKKDPKSQKEEILGTKVSASVLTTDRDTRFPIQGALGYDITQTLFIGRHVLLVEGPSDVLYIDWASKLLQAKNRTHLDRRWTLTPVNGVDKISSFVSLFGGNKLHVAAFVDLHHGQKKKIQELKKSGLLPENHVLTADTYAGQAEADTEDMLGRCLFITLINRCYNLISSTPLPKVKPKDTPNRVIQEVENHFGVLPPTVQEFDHLTPAEYLVAAARQLDKELPGVDDALERFERLFKTLNPLLPTG